MKYTVKFKKEQDKQPLKDLTASQLGKVMLEYKERITDIEVIEQSTRRNGSPKGGNLDRINFLRTLTHEQIVAIQKGEREVCYSKENEEWYLKVIHDPQKPFLSTEFIKRRTTC